MNYRLVTPCFYVFALVSDGTCRALSLYYIVLIFVSNASYFYVQYLPTTRVYPLLNTRRPSAVILIYDVYTIVSDHFTTNRVVYLFIRSNAFFSRKLDYMCVYTRLGTVITICKYTTDRFVKNRNVYGFFSFFSY